jgi:hypothetical protein
MPLLEKSIRVLGKALPKMVSPKAHAVMDYSTILLFVAGSALFWKRSKRAAVASLICGVAEAGVVAITDYRGSSGRSIGFPLHRKIDFGLSTMTATMPEFLAFADQRERAFFIMQSALIAGVTAITDFRPRHISAEPARRIAGERETRAA